MTDTDRSAFDNAQYYDCTGEEDVSANSPEDCICDYIDLFAPFGDKSIADVVRNVCPIAVTALDDDDDAVEEDYAQFGIKEGYTILKQVAEREYSAEEVLAILKEEWGEDAE